MGFRQTLVLLGLSVTIATSLAANTNLPTICEDHFLRLHSEQDLPDLHGALVAHQNFIELAANYYSARGEEKIYKYGAQADATLVEHLQSVATAFNQLYANSGLSARVDKANTYRDTALSIHYDGINQRLPQTYFERIAKRALTREGVKEIAYRPFDHEMLGTLGSYSPDRKRVSIGISDLLSVDLVPTIFLHEVTHNIIDEENTAKEVNSKYFIYNGEAHCFEKFGCSYYLNCKDFFGEDCRGYLSVSEMQTFWVSSLSEITNLATILKRINAQKTSDERNLQDLRLILLRTLRQLMHLRDTGSDLAHILNTALNAPDPTEFLKYTLPSHGDLWLSLWVDVLPAHLNTKIAIPTTFEGNDYLPLILSTLRERHEHFQKRAAFAAQKINSVELIYGQNVPENLYAHPELLNDRSPQELIRMAQILLTP